MTSPSVWEISDLHNRLLITTKYVDATSMKRCIEKLGYDHHDSFEAMISGLTDKQLQIVFDSYDQARKPTDFKLPKPYFYNILPPQTKYHSDNFNTISGVSKRGDGITPEHILWSPIVSFNYQIPRPEDIDSILQTGIIDLNTKGEVSASVECWSKDGKVSDLRVTDLTFVMSTALLKRNDWLIDNGVEMLIPGLFISHMQQYEEYSLGKVISFGEPIPLSYVEILVCPDSQVKKFSKLITESDYKHIQVTSRSSYSKHRYLRSVKKVRRLYYDV